MDSILKASVLDAAGSLVADYYSPKLNCAKFADVRWQLYYPVTGAPVGTWYLEGSEDPAVETDVRNQVYGTGSETAKWVKQNLSTGGGANHQVEIDPSATGTAVAGGAITHAGTSLLLAMITSRFPHTYMRLHYVSTSGTGSVRITKGARGA